jgi:hypothetical protein
MLPAFGMHAQTVTTTTISGNLRVNDSLHVINNINSTGDIRAAGEVISKDTMRAEKDVIVDGNAVIKNDLRVSGNSELNALRVNGALTVNTAPSANIDPCLKILMAEDLAGGDHVITLSATQITNLENAFDQSPCPQPPVVPFTWQTYGNHVNSNNRWIGTIENYDFNIKTNDKFQLICKANGDIGLGAYGGNLANTTGKKYRLFIANSGEVSAGVQDASGKYPFIVKANGMVSIGFGRPKVGGQAANAMLSVDGLILAKEIKVAIANTHWADYVFAKDYKLKPLKEVEKYVMQYKHLPEVPSENEVKEEGVNVVEMNATLLKKVEELTLYLIEQNKRLDKLEKENMVIKQQLLYKK